MNIHGFLLFNKYKYILIMRPCRWTLFQHKRIFKSFAVLSGNIYMIRKSATGVIVALAVIWGGGTWYTGTQIQPGVEKFIKDFNDAKKKGEHAYDMTLSYKKIFDKGF
ncbi:DUF945 family protein [Escherichia coli]